MAGKKKDTSGLDLQDKAFADLVLCGWVQGVAFRIVYPERKVKDGGSLSVSCNRILNDPHVKEYVRLTKARGTGYGLQEYDEGGNLMQIDKNELSRELTRLFRKETDPKLKSEIGMKLADINQFKKEQIESQQQVKYYLPMPENELVGYIIERIKADSQFANNIRLTIGDLPENIAN